MPIPSEICAQSDPPSIEKRQLWQISAYNVSSVRDSEKVQLWWIESTGFPTSYRWSVYITPNSPKGWLKKQFFRLKK